MAEDFKRQVSTNNCHAAEAYSGMSVAEHQGFLFAAFRLFHIHSTKKACVRMLRSLTTAIARLVGANEASQVEIGGAEYRTLDSHAALDFARTTKMRLGST